MKSRFKKKASIAGLTFVFAIAAIVCPARGYVKAKAAEPESECITCHTDVRELMRLTWEIEKVKPRPAKSVETSGKG